MDRHSKENNYNSSSLEIKNKIYINKSKLEIERVKCKDFYWHLISSIQHTPRAITAWENIYTNFKGNDNNFWKTIFKMPFLFTRPTSIQTFQYKVIHRTLPYNEWLKHIRIKTDDICSYCNNVDAIAHFLIDCNSNKLFWKGWARWWHSITGFNIRKEEMYINQFYLGLLKAAIMPLS